MVLPVGREDGKKPLVSGFPRWKMQSGEQLAELARKFPAANIAILTGIRSNITIVDIDAPDCLQTAIKRFGETPYQVRTPSGGFHLAYQYAGERCQAGIDGLPIDIRGDGGYAVAPPSRNPSGTPYELIQGQLSDLRRLPMIGNDALPEAGTGNAGSDNGRRNDTLFKFGLREVRACDDFETLVDCMRTENDTYDPPMSDGEVLKTAKSVWKIHDEDRNWVGRDARSVSTKSELCSWPTQLRESGDALYLLQRLQVEHGWRENQPFILANGLAKSLGWGIARLRSARELLVELGHIWCVYRGGHGKGDPPKYILTKGARNQHQ